MWYRTDKKSAQVEVPRIKSGLMPWTNSYGLFFIYCKIGFFLCASSLTNIALTFINPDKEIDDGAAVDNDDVDCKKDMRISYL